MALLLKSPGPLQGARWLRDGFRLFARHPLAFSSLLVSFLLAGLLMSIVPLVGGVVLVAAVPLLSLGFMIASESALQGGRIHPGQLLQPLRGDPPRRRALLQLCAAYAATTLAAMLAGDWVDGGALDKLQRLLAQGQSQSEVDALLADPRVAQGMVLRFGLIALLSIPFWHAPALVHWGAQGPAQALFSSTLAVWRARGAFVVYIAAWCLMIGVFSAVTGALAALAGVRSMATLLIVPGGLIFSTVFYVSLLFTFNDSFGGQGPLPRQDLQP